MHPEILPNNVEAEESILGGILFDPEAITRVIDIIEPEDFYFRSHEQIYKAMVCLHKANKPTDTMAVANWLKDKGRLSSSGGITALNQILERTVSAVNIDYLAQIIANKSLSRKLIAAGNDIAQLGMDESLDLETRIDASESKLFALRQKQRSGSAIQPITDISVDVYKQLAQIADTGVIPAIATGFYDLDNLLAGGFYPGDLVIVGGRPSMGKSALACALAYQIAAIHTQPTLIFSLEMPKDSVVMRYMSSLTEIESQRLRQGRITSTEWDSLSASLTTLSQVPVLIDDSSCPSVMEIKSKVRQVISQHGSLKLVVIDYLQLMVDGSDNNLVQRIGEVTRQLKLLAKDCNVPVMLLSQLNRAVEERHVKRPVQSDLRSSGRIEEDADLILFPYRDEYYNPDTPDRDVMEVICTKHRNGPTGTVKLLFDPAYSRLRNLARGRSYAT